MLMARAALVRNQILSAVSIVAPYASSSDGEFKSTQYALGWQAGEATCMKKSSKRRKLH
jgi:hypothetical protein